MADLVGYPLFKAFTASGSFAVGYKLYTYEAGTSTPKTCWKDEDKTSAHTNPIVLNALGEAGYPIWLDGDYKFTLTDADGAVQTGWPVDNISSFGSIHASSVIFDPYGFVSSTNVQDALEEIIDEITDNSGDTWGVMPSGVELEGQIVGLDCSPDSDADHDVSVEPGACMDSTNTVMLSSSSDKVKQIDATWAAGDNAGGLLNHSVSAVQADTLYDFYALYKASDGSVDFGWIDNSRSISSYLPTGYTKYRWLRYYLTDGDGDLLGTTQKGDWILNHKASDWVVSSGITTSFATVDHSSYIPEARIKLIRYGVADDTTDAYVIASDDGTNTSFYVGTSSTLHGGDTGSYAWSGYPKMSFMPFSTTRTFKAETGTIDLLIQAVRMKR